MKTLSKVLLLSACLVAVNTQASEPKNQRFKGGSFVGLGSLAFFVGPEFEQIGQNMVFSAKAIHDPPFDHIYWGRKFILAGKAFKGAGIGLIAIPMLINRQLIMNKAKSASQYCFKFAKKQDSGE